MKVFPFVLFSFFFQIFLDDINLERCFPDGEWTKVFEIHANKQFVYYVHIVNYVLGMGAKNDLVFCQTRRWGVSNSCEEKTASKKAFAPPKNMFHTWSVVFWHIYTFLRHL